MDVAETIIQRRSIRAFKPEPVSENVLKEMLELSVCASSWENTQPWEFAVVGGKKLDEIREAFTRMASEQPNPDISPPREYPEPYNTRRRVVGMKIYAAKGISREDNEKRRLWGVEGMRLFKAPNAIYVYIDRSFYYQTGGLNVWPLFDCGLVAENIMLLAIKYGLGTIPHAQAVLYPDVLREILGLPNSKLMVLGITIGYPDWNDSINLLRMDREPLDKVAKWYGFDK